MAVDPTAETIRSFVEEDDGGPVVMLNLLRFAGEEGRVSYGQYGARVQPLLDGVGATVLYAGDCSRTLVAPAAHRWDAMIIVRYPSRSAFLQLVGDPAYQAISHLRTEALEEAVLEATIPWG
jgi:uncharacterized protein (DUF1330 family)